MMGQRPFVPKQYDRPPGGYRQRACSPSTPASVPRPIGPSATTPGPADVPAPDLRRWACSPKPLRQQSRTIVRELVVNWARPEDTESGSVGRAIPLVEEIVVDHGGEFRSSLWRLGPELRMRQHRREPPTC